jgi:hypothetical protein
VSLLAPAEVGLLYLELRHFLDIGANGARREAETLDSLTDFQSKATLLQTMRSL